MIRESIFAVARSPPSALRRSSRPRPPPVVAARVVVERVVVERVVAITATATATATGAGTLAALW
jgi:hypothetical protein